MEPNNSNPNIGSELPQPENMAGDFMRDQPNSSPEAQYGAPSLQQPVQAPGPIASNPLAPNTVPNSVIPPAPMSSLTGQLIADDADLIEKEWVLKAKAIVMHTKDDPHKQNIEMNKVKADYLKKRYNKDLKTSEG